MNNLLNISLKYCFSAFPLSFTKKHNKKCQQMEFATKHCMLNSETYQGSRNFTQTRFTWFATFCNSLCGVLVRKFTNYLQEGAQIIIQILVPVLLPSICTFSCGPACCGSGGILPDTEDTQTRCPCASGTCAASWTF